MNVGYILCRMVSKTLFAVGIAVLFFMCSCRRTPDMYEKIENMRSRQVCLDCHDMIIWHGDGQAELKQEKRYRYSMIVYADSLECSSCFIRGISEWHRLLNLEKSGIVKFIFIIQPKQGDVQYVYNHMYLSHLKHDIFIDAAGVFRKRNPHIPDDSMCHVFLLDSSNRVVLVGNPLHSGKIKEMLYKIIETK